MTLSALYDVPAPAKLNLFLHVVGRRADGYHLLQSVFCLIDWADTLHFECRDDGRLQRHDLNVPLPGDDLCLKAARALQAASATSLGADISVLKQVPAGAGLGGGSSDAATVLLALNRLWRLNWPRERLLQLAPALGADVPFFVGGRNAFVEGIGERLTPIELPVRGFVVVKPPIALATGSIFGSPLLVRNTPAVILAGSPESTGSNSGLNEDVLAEGFGRNDLQPPAEAVAPEVARLVSWMAGRFGNSRLTGSGSSVFSRVELNSGTGVPPEATLADLPPTWVGRQCRSLSAHPLVEWAGG